MNGFKSSEMQAKEKDVHLKHQHEIEGFFRFSGIKDRLIAVYNCAEQKGIKYLRNSKSSSKPVSPGLGFGRIEPEGEAFWRQLPTEFSK